MLSNNYGFQCVCVCVVDVLNNYYYDRKQNYIAEIVFNNIYLKW